MVINRVIDAMVKMMKKLLFWLFVSATMVGCSTLTTSDYEATALTNYTWQVKYANDLTSEPSPRLETFASTSLLNRNGLKPSGAVTGPDDQGLWWAALPSRPTVDEIEQRKGSQSQASKPELLKSVKYELTYKIGSQERTLPTNYDVYRQVAKSYPSRAPLQLTLGVGDDTVEKAEPIGN